MPGRPALGSRLLWAGTGALVLVVMGGWCAAFGSSPVPSVAASAAASSPRSTGAGPSPDTIIEAGACDRIFHDLCNRVAVDQWHDVAYTPPIACGSPAQGTVCQLAMDITAPTSGGPWPIIVVLPGGPVPPSERFPGDFDPFARALAGQGAVVMVSGWREDPDFGGGYPTSFEDVACAIGVARSIGPDYGASPDRVTLVGHSLGGWPAMVVGVTPTPFTPAEGSCDATAGSLRPDAAVSMDGAIDMVAGPVDLDYVVGFVGGGQEARPDAWDATDPFALVRRYPAGPGAIPLLLIHGTADGEVPPKVSESFQAALVEAGYHSQLLELPGGGHAAALEREASIDAVMTIATGR